MSMYPSPPGPRMAYHRDGTQVVDISAGGVIAAPYSSTVMGQMNDEYEGDSPTGGVVNTSGEKVAWLFPEPRDLIGYFFITTPDNGSVTALAIETSTDTTNGQDGTWTSRTTTGPSNAYAAAKPLYRTGVQAVSWTGIIGLRIASTGGSGGGRIKVAHLYGAPSAAGDFVTLWHPTLDQPLGFVDWGDVPRGNTATATFRVKNRSATKTATNVVVSMEALTDSTPTQVSQHDFSLDGGTTYASTRTIASIGPGAISGVVTMRRQTSSSAQLGTWSQRILAVPASLA